MTWAEWAQAKNDKARAKGRWRELRNYDGLGLRGLVDGRPVVAFASNDYLGLSAHPAVMVAAHEAIDRWGTGAGAARLISGSRPVHSDLEARLAEWRGTEAALVFPTGFAANVGVLSALAGPGVLICSDALNHASIVDGCRVARSLGASVEVYPHGDTEALAYVVGAWTGRTVVVTDSVFSMDGDVAPIADLAGICAQHDALLILDEAHGVLGPHVDPDQLGCEVLRVGTLSKALGSQGGFVAAPRAMTEMLVNRCRSFIFTTALAPASAAAALAALDILMSPEGEALLARLNRFASRLRPGRAVQTPIVPFVLGSEQAALDASAALLARGLLVPAVRPPTVPPGTCRLRVALSAAHAGPEIDILVTALGQLGLGQAPA